MTVVSSKLWNSSGAYSSTDFGDFLTFLGEHVIPEYLNELTPTSTATLGKVKIRSGAAICSGRYYTNDADVELPIAAAANNRIDRIVLRDNGSFAIRLTVVQGVAAANPSPPALTNGDTQIAWIWVPAGFNPAADTIADEDIHDERLFRENLASSNTQSRVNLMYNSEFMAYSGGALGTVAPEGWVVTAPAPATSIASAALLGSQPRGRSVRIQGNAGEGMQTYVRTASYSYMGSRQYTLKGLINITSGSVQIDIDGGTVIKNFYRTGVDQEFIIRFTSTDAEVNILITANTSPSDFYVGQIKLVNGYIPGQFGPKHEMIMFDYVLTDASWSATAKSTGTTAIDLSASFGGLIPEWARGIIVKLRANDSGSAAGTPGLYTEHYSYATGLLSRLRLDGLPNDDIREVQGYVPIYNISGFTNRIRIGHLATGVGTLDATVEIIGIIT